MDTKEKKELAVLAVGVVILINLSNFASAGEIAPLKEEVNPLEIQEVKYTGRDGRDPLDNSIVLEEAAQETAGQEIVFPKESFLVSALIWGSSRPQAIINNKVVDIGETLSGGKIVGIDKEGVHISFEGREVLLPIK